MILLQLSANIGPEECCLAVRHALAYLNQEAATLGVDVAVVEAVPSEHPGNLRSVLLALEGAAALDLARRWQGSVQWICTSPYRPSHKRKNWFIGAELFEPDAPDHDAASTLQDKDLRYETVRSSGPGGQHVNTTDSAVRATHLPSGLSVKVQTERSQHANKRLARALLACKLAAQAQELQGQNRAQRRIQHYQVERGNARRVFKGEDFRLLT
ncbi:MAG: peptide chain release factor H [Rhodoferax sp.]|nr:peptide chain release factor H [Rhodoferax sp.]